MSYPRRQRSFWARIKLSVESFYVPRRSMRLPGIKILTCKFFASFSDQHRKKSKLLSVIKNIRFKRIWRITHNTIFADITILMFSKKLRTKLSMNGVPFRFSRQKNSTWIPAKLVWLSTIQPGQNWANLKSQNYKNVSDLSIGFTSITSEIYLYLLRVSGQRDF